MKRSILLMLCLGNALPAYGAYICPKYEDVLARPIPMGVSIGNVDSYNAEKIGQCGGGTAGILLQDADGFQYILSNNHVIAGQPNTTYPLLSSITQPGPEDLPMPTGQHNSGGGTFCNPVSEVDEVASLSGFMPIIISPSLFNFEDAAWAGIVSSPDVSDAVLNFGVPCTPTTEPYVSEQLTSMARTSCVRDCMIIKTGVTLALGTYPNVRSMGDK
jgi:hypothetical protein